MLQEILIKKTRQQRRQGELENLIPVVKEEVTALLESEVEFNVKAGEAISKVLSVDWRVAGSVFSCCFTVRIRQKEKTELEPPEIVEENILGRPQGLLWAALEEVGFPRRARMETDLGEKFYELRNIIEETENYVAFFNITVSDC